MKKVSLLFFLNVIAFSFLTAQPCNCTKALHFIETEVENNLASYQHQVVQYKRQQSYLQHKAAINTLAKKATKQKDCIGVVSKYISFFRDEHLSIQYKEGFFKFKSLQDTAAVRKTFENDEIVIPTGKSVNKALEGIWYFQDGSFSINIFPSQSVTSKWTGVMTDDDGLLWRKGQVKIQLQPTGKDTYEAIYWRGTRQPKAIAATLKNGVLSLGKLWRFYRTKEQALTKNFKPAAVLEFKALSDSTNYLRIPTFDPAYAKQIDSVVLSNIAAIKLKPNLIIDVRNNGGGSDRSYRALLPLLYDKPVVTDPITACVWVSKNNFKYYDATKYDYAATKQDSLAEANYVERLRPYAGMFTPAKFSSDTLEKVYGYPKKIGVLINRWCASSTEGFTIVAMESKKVQTFGENTNGMLSYGDWRRVDVPDLPIFITLTTKKMVFVNGADIESVGIKPDFLLDSENEPNWIKETIKIVEQ